MRSVAKGVWGVLVVLLCATASGAVEIEVEGLRWRTELRLERLLREIILPEEDARITDAVQVEDALLILRSELERVGYLEPSMEYVLYVEDRELGRGLWDVRRQLADLRWEAADRLRFEIDPGERAHFETVEFQGLTALSADEARAFFYPAAGLFVSESERAFSPSGFQSSLNSLVRRLGQLGYLNATAVAIQGPEIAETGEVRVTVGVRENARHVWGEVAFELDSEDPDAGETPWPAIPPPGSLFTEETEEDFVQLVRNRFLTRGFADVRVSAERQVAGEVAGNEARVDVTVRIQPGPRVRLREVQFEGLEATNEEFLRRVADLRAGDYLSRLEVEEAQFELGRLGIFETLRSQLVPIEGSGGSVRDVVFRMEERSRRELGVLLGYGSYELFRVGLEARALNLFGRAHSARLRLRQSYRSTAGQLTYNVPDPFPEIDQGQLRLIGLRREEVAFTREEALAAAGVERTFFNGSLHTSAEYRFELLRAVDPESGELVGDTRATVGSILLGAAWDTRDRIISPRSGEQLRAQLELASPGLGADSDFQRLQVKTSLHRSFKQNRLRWHFALQGGLLTRVGSEADDLPVNKRFFPGGENSVRGYQEGEAAPLDAEGRLIGAEAMLQGNVEFELQMLRSLSLVLFVDGVWIAADVQSPTEGDALFSAGLGLRYSTPLGPLRLEYGHNLNPRNPDPSGTVHLSIGFPF